jgi:hypothetical protein
MGIELSLAIAEQTTPDRKSCANNQPVADSVLLNIILFCPCWAGRNSLDMWGQDYILHNQVLCSLQTFQCPVDAALLIPIVLCSLLWQSCTKKKIEFKVNALYYMQFNLWIVLYAFYSMPCALCIVFCALCHLDCILCIVFYALYSLHCILCFVFYALYSMLCILCIVFNAMYSMHCIQCIVFNALYSMHCIQCIVFYALYVIRCIICIVYYAHNSIKAFILSLKLVATDRQTDRPTDGHCHI